jgi:hypothetical protein
VLFGVGGQREVVDAVKGLLGRTSKFRVNLDKVRVVGELGKDGKYTEMGIASCHRL